MFLKLPFAVSFSVLYVHGYIMIHCALLSATWVIMSARVIISRQ